MCGSLQRDEQKVFFEKREVGMLKYFKLTGVIMGLLYMYMGICAAEEISYDEGGVSGYAYFCPT